jgi:hypothetical protein
VKIDITNKKSLVFPLKVVILTTFVGMYKNHFEWLNSPLFCGYIGFHRQKWLILPLLVLSVFEVKPILSINSIYGESKNMLSAKITLKLQALYERAQKFPNYQNFKFENLKL